MPRMTAAPEGQNDKATVLLELARDVTSTLELQEVLDKTFVALRRLMDFGGGAIQLIEEGFLVAAATDPPMAPEAKSVRIPVGSGVSGAIAATGEPIYIPDIWSDPRVHPEGKKKGVSTGVTSYFGVPLIQHGEPVGVVQIDSPRKDAFSSEARATMIAFLPTVAAAVQNAMVFAREREALLHLEETARLKRDFLAVASHELRTPLTSITGLASTLMDHADKLDRELIGDIGERMWRSGRRLWRVMGDLLDLSRIERGTLKLALRKADLGEIVREVVREQANDDHEYVIECDESFPPVPTDPDRLHQVLGNLLSNARKFSPPQSAIVIRAFNADGAVCAQVADSGPGIPEAHREKIFDPFVQVDSSETRAAEGMGVGLFLCRQLCQRLGCEISLESTVGEGTCFTVRIPLDAKPA